VTLSFSVQPSDTVAGSADTFTITARDAFGAPTCYTGTVHFTASNNSNAIVPADYTFTPGDAGSHVFAVTFFRAGQWSVTVTDTVNPPLTATSTFVMVHAGPAVVLKVANFPPLPPGFEYTVQVAQSLPLQVFVEDAFQNFVQTYTGTVHFTSSTTADILLLFADYTFTPGDAGQHTFFPMIFFGPGTATITVTDTVNTSLTGSSGPIHAV